MTVGELLALLQRSDVSDDLIIGVETDDNSFYNVNAATLGIDKKNEIFYITLNVESA
jgi:hypothetical protein